jgi:hypothetical protein
MQVKSYERLRRGGSPYPTPCPWVRNCSPVFTQLQLIKIKWNWGESESESGAQFCRAFCARGRKKNIKTLHFVGWGAKVSAWELRAKKCLTRIKKIGAPAAHQAPCSSLMTFRSAVFTWKWERGAGGRVRRGASSSSSQRGFGNSRRLQFWRRDARRCDDDVVEIDVDDDKKAFFYEILAENRDFFIYLGCTFLK